MKIYDLAMKFHISQQELWLFVRDSKFSYRRNMPFVMSEVSDTDELAIIEAFLNKKKATVAQKKEDAEELRARRAATARMLITSGFNFDGYHVTKYSGYISGDDVVQIERGTDSIFTSAKDVGESLSSALVSLRRNALTELKDAAYDLGCNAVIGVDFDYITLDPETANFGGGTTYLPYVFCVTANGNAVVIEKDE